MIFYTLDTATDTYETGPIFPQIKAMRPGYDFNKLTSIHNLNFKELPDFQPDLDYFILDQKAKITDLLSNMISPFGLLLSEKMKKLLEQFKLPEHGFYPATIAAGNIKLDKYFWFLPNCNLSDQVDYSKTTFYSKDTFNNVEKLNIKNLEDVFELRPKIGYTKKIVSEEIYFKSGFKPDYELFMIGGFDFSVYLSEDLKSALINEKITGIKLKPTGHLII